MIAHRLLPALVATAVAAGCSHQQPPQTTTVPAVAAATAPRSAAPAARPSEPAPQPTPTGKATQTSKGDKELAVFFDFDSALLRDDARPVLQKVASQAQAHHATVLIQGNCDELGTIEYNLALGEHRAVQAKDYLTKLGVPPTKIETVSYGSQRPKVAGHDEQAHAQNRRDDFIVR
jgi:peptidoglycan-associated lipoprotein